MGYGQPVNITGTGAPGDLLAEEILRAEQNDFKVSPLRYCRQGAFNQQFRPMIPTHCIKGDSHSST
jgi:hypothetical protein